MAPSHARAVQTSPAAAVESPFDAAEGGSCAGPACAADVMRVAHVTEVPVEKDAPAVQGHPLTSIVVTQCNLIVAVYLTMPDGRLLRYDHSASVSGRSAAGDGLHSDPQRARGSLLH